MTTTTSPRAPSTAPVLPGFEAKPAVGEVITLTCPTDPAVILAEVERGLYRALVRRGETWHLRTCLASGVNSRPVACSDPCVRVQIGLAWAGIWRERAARRGQDRRTG